MSVLVVYKTTAVGGSRAGGSRANFWILRKILSEALGPVWIFQQKIPLVAYFIVFYNYFLKVMFLIEKIFY